MFAAQDWKDMLLENQGRKPVKLMLVNIRNAIAAEETREAITKSRKIQRSQQDNWDAVNDEGSFPASDPVARY